MKVEDNEMLVSFDVVSLFTKTLVMGILDVIKNRLEKDKTLKKRTNMDVEDILSLLQFVLNTT